MAQQDIDSDFVVVDPPGPNYSRDKSTNEKRSSNREMIETEGVQVDDRMRPRNLQQIKDFIPTSTPSRITRSEGDTPHPQLDVNIDEQSNFQAKSSKEASVIGNSRNDTSKNIPINFPNSSASTPSYSRPRRTPRPISRFSDNYDQYYTLQADFDSFVNSTGSGYISTGRGSDDFTFDEVLARSDRDEWIRAAVSEIDSLVSKETWVKEDQSLATSRILPGTWTFKIKRKPD